MYSNKFAAKLVNIRQLWKKDVGKLNIFMVLSTYYPTFRFLTTLQEHLRFKKSSKPAWDEYDDFDPLNLAFEEKLRIIRDHVACMTDKYALDQYRKLSGQTI